MIFFQFITSAQNYSTVNVVLINLFIATVDSSLKALKRALPGETFTKLIGKWYIARHSPGSMDGCGSEWFLFAKFLMCQFQLNQQAKNKNASVCQKKSLPAKQVFVVVCNRCVYVSFYDKTQQVQCTFFKNGMVMFVFLFKFIKIF